MKKIFLLLALCCLAAVGTQAAKEIYAVKDGYSTLILYYDDQREARGGVTNWQTDEFREKISTVEFDASFQYARPTTTYHWFYDYKKLSAILRLSYLNTADVTTMEGMFAGCEDLPSLDVRQFNTAKVTNMSYMFYGCKYLRSLNLSSFKTGEVLYMNSMFEGCETIEALDLGKFDMTKVTEAKAMFKDCKALKSIYYDGGWMSGSISSADSKDMFAGCEQLVGGAGTTYDAENVKVSYAQTDGGTSDPGYFTLPLRVYSVFVESSGTLTYYYGNDYNTHTEGTMEFYEPDAERFATYHDKVKKAVIDTTVAKTYLTSTRSLFYGNKPEYKLTELETIEGLRNLTMYLVTDMSLMFYECNSLKSLDLSSFYTSSVTSMTSMFAGCSKLTSLDFSSTYFSTSNVTNMDAMFRACSSLQTIDLSRFQTDKVTSMSRMFQDCKALDSVDVSYLNTANVTSLGSMFRNCEKLTHIDISGFDIRKVTNTAYMFSGCKAIETIICRTNWAESTLITSSDKMFEGCEALKGPNGTTFNSTYTNKLYARPDGINGDKGYFSMGVHVYTHFDGDDHMLTFFYDDKRFTRDGTNETYDPEAARFPGYGDLVLQAQIDESMKDAKLTSTKRMFQSLVYLNDIEGMEYLNTEKVEDMSYMFEDCNTLASLDLSNFKTGNVKNMRTMFGYCTNLESLDLSSFNTAKVESMKNMFGNCYALKDIDISSFKINSLKETDGMFGGCTALETIWCNADMSASDILTSSDLMFDGCTALEGGNETKFDDSEPLDKTYARPDTYVEKGYFTAVEVEPELYGILESDGETMSLYYNGYRVVYGGKLDWKKQYRDVATLIIVRESVRDYKPTDLAALFMDFKKLERIWDLNYLNTEEVTDMSSMFSGCEALKTLDLSGFKTNKVKKMGAMFRNCTALESVDLSTFSTDSLKDMDYMFTNCSALESVDLSSFRTDNLKSIDYMFTNCTALESVDLSSFNVANVTSASRMFQGCTALKTVNLNGWNINEHASLWSMFDKCSSLETIYCSSTWQTDKSSDLMFNNCTKLKGPLGTECSGSAFDDVKYARPDEGAENPGYFTGFFKVTLKAEHGSITVDQNIDLNSVISGTYLSFKAKPDKDYYFDKWENYDPSTGLIVKKDITVTAVFKQKEKEKEDLDQTTGDQRPSTTKFLHDGQLYIMYNGTTYNVQGAEVR